ncbi:hypothetical protein B11417_10800 [Campylobacter jejuni]|nr:hypothetical protein B10617_09000 [Campylobacter jejuni]GML63747.1 hypothetical protein B11417_10800 [Campylobacter jejuni]
MQIIKVSITLKIAEIFITIFFGYLSAKKPEGESIRIKGSKIKALTIAFKNNCSLPS